MKMFLDTEFNQKGGELISIGIQTMNPRKFFYSVLKITEPYKPWIIENVVPILYGEPRHPNTVRESLQEFLCQFENCQIFTDHPADIRYFTDFLEHGDRGEWITVPPLQFEIVHDLGGTSRRSAAPHNALSDAQALKELYLERMRTNPFYHDF